MDPRRLLDQIEPATERLLRTVRSLTDAEVGQPSLLPGWTRGHVLTHLARTADAMHSLFEWARTGRERPAYESAEARAAAIEAGARRSTAELAADVAASAELFRADVLALPDEAWDVPVHILGSAPFPVRQLPVRRLVEVELHHTDLGAGYGPADWPAEFAAMDLGEPMRTQRADRLARR